MGAAGLLAASPRLLAGCSSSDAAAVAMPWPTTISTEPPILGGDSALDWWNRGNYASVMDELDVANLEVVGAIPPTLNGLFVRNGANPASGESSHWFMGDGMVHGMRIENGQAKWYRNRFIQTQAYKESTASPAANRANTSVYLHNGKLLALYEAGMPTELSPSDLSTIGEYDYAGALQGSMTAHPKTDPATGALHFMGYNSFNEPYLTYYKADASGILVTQESIEIPQPTMMHDFQLTKTHAVFYDLPIVFDVNELLASGFPFRWAPDLGARIGVMPLNGTGADTVWVDVDTCFMFHTFNAYDDAQGRVVLEGCRLPSLWADSAADAITTPTPWRWTIDPVAATVSEGAFQDFGMDFPMIDKRMQGQKHRISYGLRLVGGTDDYPTHPVGIAKHDAASGNTVRWDCGEAYQPDEALFVPDSGAAGEDEGWLLTVVYDRANDSSLLCILDASNIEAGPVARVSLPRRVPFGFHGTWVDLG
ncbi:MAG: carotenoid cleavage dioxygenase-like enzyme [Myxococcota bacterium]|jgi:carotenoid cleavage dioxygenase-like enzyme